MVYIKDELNVDFTGNDINHYLSKQYSEYLIEIDEYKNIEGTLYLVIQSELLDETSLNILWNYLKEYIVSEDFILLKGLASC